MSRGASMLSVLLAALLLTCVSAAHTLTWKLTGSLLGGYNSEAYTVKYNLALVTQLQSGTHGYSNATYLILSGSGTRKLTSGGSTNTSVLQQVLSINNVGGNDNLLFPYTTTPTDSPSGFHTLLDFNGVTFNITKRSPLVHVQGYTDYSAVNLFWDTSISTPQYSEEGQSDNHEVGITKNTFKATLSH